MVQEGLTEEGAKRAAGRIALMPFFPGSDRYALGIVIEELAKVCRSDAEAEWLAVRMSQLFKQWPGLGEMRATFCKRFKPADGGEVSSQVYQDGFPSESELPTLPEPLRLQLETEQPPKLPQLPPAVETPLLAGQVSADPELANLVHEIAVKATMPTRETRSAQQISQMLYGRSTKPSPKTTAPAAESATPATGSKRIIQADIDAELRAAGRPIEERPQNIAGLGVGE